MEQDTAARSLRATVAVATTALVVAVLASVVTNPSISSEHAHTTGTATSTEAPRPARVGPTTTSSSSTTEPPATTTTEVAVLGAALEASAAPPPPPPPPAAAAAPEPAAAPAAAPAPAPAPAPAYTVSPGAEAEVLGFINARRAEHGLGTVSRNSCLDGIARSWSQDMASRQTLAHNPSAASQASSCVSWSAAGENVGYGPSAARVNQQWWESSSHRATTLGGAYTQVGIGAVWDGSTMWVTVDFVG